jgi:phosphatidylserine/phosphatidylglycerophosphate/cardiolipin synthase-like enzyme
MALLAACAHHPDPVRKVSSVEAVDRQEKSLQQVQVTRESLLARLDPLVGFFHNADHPVAYDLLNHARRSIDIEIYEMKDPKFRRLLQEALARGVKVRIVKDSNTVGDSCDELSEPTPRDRPECRDEKLYVAGIRAAGAQYVFFNKKALCAEEGKSCFQHGKMIIVDSKYLLLSTGNFNTSSFCNLEEPLKKCNRDFSYVTRNREVIRFLQSVFDKDLKRQRWELRDDIADGSRRVTVSPFSRPRLVSLIQSATREVWVQNQYLEDPGINAALVEVASRGVEVKVMVSDFCNFGRPSPGKYNKSLSIYNVFDGAGIKTRIFTPAMKIKGLSGYLHSKAILVDNEVAWIGSINGSVMSTTKNREFGIIFRGKRSIRKLANILREDFEHPASTSWQRSLACDRSPEDAGEAEEPEAE